MDQVETRLKAYSPDALREILLEWARETHPSKRNEFLARLVPPTAARGTAEPAQNLERLWKEAVDNIGGYGYNKQGVAEGFQQAMDRVFRSVHLSEDEEDRYVRWVTEETGRRVDAIVGEKHRQSYHKAATLLVALAEMLASRNMKSKGTAAVARYREKYRRHSAFRQELDAAISGSIMSA